MPDAGDRPPSVPAQNPCFAAWCRGPPRLHAHAHSSLCTRPASPCPRSLRGPAPHAPPRSRPVPHAGAGRPEPAVHAGGARGDGHPLRRGLCPILRGLLWPQEAAAACGRPHPVPGDPRPVPAGKDAPPAAAAVRAGARRQHAGAARCVRACTRTCALWEGAPDVWTLLLHSIRGWRRLCWGRVAPMAAEG